MPGSSSQSANRTRDALARLQSLEQATIIQRERSQTLLSHLLCLRGHQLLPSPPVISMPSMLREHPIVCTCVYVYRLPPLAYTIIWRFCLRTSFHLRYGLLACRHCHEVVSRCTYSRHSQRHLPPSSCWHGHRTTMSATPLLPAPTPTIGARSGPRKASATGSRTSWARGALWRAARA